jgi:hypothetical protein
VGTGSGVAVGSVLRAMLSEVPPADCGEGVGWRRRDGDWNPGGPVRMKRKMVPVEHELLCEAIGELKRWADAVENGGDEFKECPAIKKIIRKLDAARMKAKNV